MKKKRWFHRILIIGLICITTLSFVVVNEDKYFEIAKNLDIFTTLFKEVNMKYVDEVNPSKLINTAITSMLESLDPYTNFISEAEIEDYKFMKTGQYGGIGALIQKKDDYVAISEVYQGFPADKSGLLAGDIIIEVDGKSVKGKSVEEVSSLLKGQPKTTVKLLIKRYNESAPIEKIIEREEIKIDNIPYYGMVTENIGFIKLTAFMENASDEVRKAFEKLKNENNLKGIILDLRGNGGGLLREAVNICNIFIKKGQEIVRTKGRLQEGSTIHYTMFNPVDTEIPLVVLVDKSSASASEIVSGAIQDLDRGVIIGQRTFGKGLVQNVYPLSYNTQLKITIAKYYIPSGRCIQAIDYSHRKEDGSVDNIPDSLISAFKTTKGRIVYDGGGIVPDITIEPLIFSPISVSLITKQLIFDYATKFRREHKSIPPPKEFKITDEIYNDFVNFLSDKDYDYKTKTEEILENFKKTSTDEKYFERISSEYENLYEKIKHNKNEDLKVFREEIEELLKDEIISRYYYLKGRIEGGLKDDIEVKKAIEVISNPNLYNSILNGTYKKEETPRK